MSELHLKVTIGNAELTLEGEAKMVFDLFYDIREKGFGSIEKLAKISSKHEKKDEACVCEEIKDKSLKAKMKRK